MGNSNNSRITIYLDRNNPFYFSDESVSGAVGLNIYQGKQKVDEIYITLTGEVVYKTTEIFTIVRGRTATRTEYHHVPVYFNKVIFAQIEPGEKEITYDQGQYLWLFEIPLTDYLPPTINQFETYSFIRYNLEVVMNKPWYRPNKREIKYLTIYPHVNLLQNPQCLSPTIFRKENKKKITLKITLNKLGYVHGELIIFKLEIENPRIILIKYINLSLLQLNQIEKTAHGNTLFQTTLPNVRNLKDQQIRKIFAITIPSIAIPPSYQFQGGIEKNISVKIYYFLRFAVKVQGIFTDFDLDIPIILGTEPNPQQSIFIDDNPSPDYDFFVQDIKF
jgi:hypothetical protein